MCYADMAVRARFKLGVHVCYVDMAVRPRLETRCPRVLC